LLNYNRARFIYGGLNGKESRGKALAHLIPHLTPRQPNALCQVGRIVADLLVLGVAAVPIELAVLGVDLVHVGEHLLVVHTLVVGFVYCLFVFFSVIKLKLN
jgi:hypothetical protein